LSQSELDVKLEKMREILRSLQPVAVAFSAGVDSTFVLKVAIDTLGPAGVVAVTGRSESLAEGEFEQCRELARGMGAEHVIIDTGEMNDPNYRMNPENRCYFCKSDLYSKLDSFVAERGLKAVVNGVNADDYSDWRPGIQAGAEHAVHAPCAEAGMTKADIRALSARFGLPTFDKPASPCLASRVQYGEEITAAKLKQIERSEALLHQLGFRECRVRHHGNLARIEVPPAEIERLCQPEVRARINAGLREFGYAYVTLDIRGFRSGSMNEVIAFGKRQGAGGA
jgi:pyridinium-3,5-biscarboxylic acid mononucleotide sulfurtransferase